MYYQKAIEHQYAKTCIPHVENRSYKLSQTAAIRSEDEMRRIYSATCDVIETLNLYKLPLHFRCDAVNVGCKTK